MVESTPDKQIIEFRLAILKTTFAHFSDWKVELVECSPDYTRLIYRVWIKHDPLISMLTRQGVTTALDNLACRLEIDFTANTVHVFPPGGGHDYSALIQQQFLEQMEREAKAYKPPTPADRAKQYVQHVLKESGLATNDPEFATLPTNLPMDPDAMGKFVRAVEEAKKQKAERRERERQESLKKAREKVVPVYIGGGVPPYPARTRVDLTNNRVGNETQAAQGSAPTQDAAPSSEPQAAQGDDVPSWERIPEHAWDRQALKLWWEGFTSPEIGLQVNVTGDRVRNRLSELRKKHGNEIVPTDEERKR